MAIPIRSIPVLEGEVAERFMREMKKAEKRRGTIKFSQEEVDGFKKMMKQFHETNGAY
jgi:hypothetical protein